MLCLECEQHYKENEMADQPIKLYDHEIHNSILTGLTENGAHVTAAIKKHVGDIIHTTEHVFHLQPKPVPVKEIAKPETEAEKKVV